jgi:RNA polymerase sigma-70 factor (ECF subfamily)
MTIEQVVKSGYHSLRVPEDQDLIGRLQRRDGQAMVALYDLYGKLVYSIILRTVRDQAAAEDLAQETFLKVWNRIHTFDVEKGNFEGWLVTVARNRALDYLRSTATSPTVAASNLDDLERSGYFRSGEGPAELLAKKKAVTDALKSLPEDQREVIEMTHYEGMTQSEIAARLGKPLGTVKGMVRGALKKLRDAMTPGTLTGGALQ